MPEIKTRTHAHYGWSPDLPDHRDAVFAVVAPVGAAPRPASVDLRPNMPPVYDQGQLGSCTANALGAAFEYDQIKQALPNHWVPSRLMIYYLERKMEGTIHQDSGAQIRDGAKVLAKYGVCPESHWPYDINKFAVAPDATDLKIAKLNQVLRYARVDQTIDALEGTLALGYPVVFGFSVYQSFESAAVAKSGIVPMPGPKEKALGGHAVLLCGYDSAKQLFLVRNSWGSSWGQGGYFWMPYAYVTDGNLADDFWALYSVEPGQ